MVQTAPTLTHAQTIPYLELDHPVGEPASRVRAKQARHAPLTAYAAAVVDGAQEHAFCACVRYHLFV